MPYGTVNADTLVTSTSGGILGAGNASIMKNRIINGAMVIDQRNAGASVTLGAVNPQYTLDRWAIQASQASKISVQQNAGSVTPPVGFTKYLGVTSLSAYSVGSGDYYSVRQSIEGFNVADLAWGTASAKTVTLSFQVYSSLTGTFGGSLCNDSFNRSYPFTYTISSANTWTTINVTIAGDTTGTWLTNNGQGIIVTFGLGVGSTYSGTAGSWQASGLLSATGATSVVGTNGATFYITGVQLEVGSSATGFEYVNYQTSLANCQRYCNRLDYASGASVNTGYADSATSARGGLIFPTMRTSASASASSATHFKLDNGAGAFVGTGISFDGLTPTSARMILVTSGMTSGQGGIFLSVNAGAYILLTAEL
jgi:hypothetical protein